ncbi:predicted protein [Plenodomus lingam JN3]|uniref:Uncharacterized protein n=1 Tax=Leptosphaeria maculans (strain JN3 / isolate v23.1.3 / race Av1-4-5-6-7-8) TaxID=985895 RepID=E4ZGD4_LEPMJ|nr:predicted protein [Plenodomus lingam JN3]CBX90354.1 predicted protein [Plenodomus lingam JN3]
MDKTGPKFIQEYMRTEHEGLIFSAGRMLLRSRAHEPASVLASPLAGKGTGGFHGKLSQTHKACMLCL